MRNYQFDPNESVLPVQEGVEFRGSLEPRYPLLGDLWVNDRGEWRVRGDGCWHRIFMQDEKPARSEDGDFWIYGAPNIISACWARESVLKENKR